MLAARLLSDEHDVHLLESENYVGGHTHTVDLEVNGGSYAADLLNHGLLQLRDRPQWKTIVGGAVTYVKALLHPLGDRVRLNCPVGRI